MPQRIPLALILVLFAASPLAAQQSTDAPPQTAAAPGLVIRTDTSMVNLPLVVRDKRGALVKSLSKDELTLTEDGKPQTIRYFDHDADLPLALGLLVDVSYSQRDALDDERTASQSFLDAMLGTQDKAFLVQFAHEVDLLADPTGSHGALQAALQQLSISSPGSSGSDSSQDDPGSQGRAHGGGTQLYDAIFLSSDEVIKKLPNRRALIVLTDGVDHGSKETLAQAIEAAQRADAILYAIYFPGTESQHSGFGEHGGGQGGHGGGWPGGGGGWPGGGGRGGRQGGGGDRPHEEPRVDGRKILQRMTYETGGDYFEVSKKQTVAEIYQQIAEELRGQYRLGYTPPVHDGPGFHEVVVLPKDTKLTVQTRTGYYSDK